MDQNLKAGNSSTQRNPVYDVARSLCVIYIVCLWHLSDYSPWVKKFVGHGIFPHITVWALGAFAMMSALCLGAKYAFDSWGSVRGFYARRLVRILPLFAVALLAFPNSIIPLFAVKRKLMVLFGVSNFAPGGNVPTLWFISMIVVFYFLFPFVSALAKKSPPMACAFGLALEVGFMIGIRCLGWEIRLAEYWPCFLFGTLAGDKSHRGVLEKATLIGAIAAIPCLWLLPPEPPSAMKTIVAFSGALAVLLFSRACFSLLSYPKAWQTIAYASMCAYLFHRTIYQVFLHVGLPKDGPALAAFLALICAPAIFVFGWVIQKSYDELCGRFLTRR